jgi:hypothetical protein
MYEVLAMIKPGSAFTPDEMAAILQAACGRLGRDVRRQGSRFTITAEGAEICLELSEASHVVVESNEIAEKFGIPCAGCVARYEMSGDDPDMVLFDDYLLINEGLEETGRFVLFDPHECRLLFGG